MEKVDNKVLSVGNIILYILPILGVGVIVPLIFGKNNLSLLGSYLAIPLILAPIVYVKQSGCETNFKIFDRKLFPLPVSLYFIFITISMYLLYTFDIRPIIYYLIIAIASGFILLEILLFDITEKKEIVILLQIAILIVDIIWGVTLKYNFFIGRTDTIGHVWLIQNLIANAHVTEIFDVYKPFPLWHILCTFVYNILGTSLSIPKIVFFTSGLIYSFVPIGTYLVSIRMFKDQKIALLSALFVAFYPEIMFYGMYSISRSVVSFLEIILILILMDPNNSKKVFLSIVLIFSLIVYHPASMPFILSIFFIISILKVVYDRENGKSFLPLNFLILAISMTLFYWTYYALILFSSIINNILTPAPLGTLTESIIFTPLNELLNYLQYSPLLFFVIIGFFAAMNSRKIPTLGKIFCMIGLLIVPVTFPGPSLLLNKLASNFNLARFGEYTFLFVGLTGAIGFHELYNKSKKYIKIFPIILFISMAFLSVSNDFTASDNPLVKRPFYTFYLTDEEETAFVHIASITQGYVMSDYVTERYLFSSKYENKSNILELNREKMKFLTNQTEDVLLIRKSELAKRPLKFYSSFSDNFIVHAPWYGYDYHYQDESSWDDLINYNKIYDSNSVTGFN